MQEYEQLKREQEKLHAEVKKMGSRNELWKASMDTKLEQWLDPLRELVAKISKNFSQFFSKLPGCVGEVRLDEPKENKVRE